MSNLGREIGAYRRKKACESESLQAHDQGGALDRREFARLWSSGDFADGEIYAAENWNRLLPGEAEEEPVLECGL